MYEWKYDKRKSVAHCKSKKIVTELPFSLSSRSSASLGPFFLPKKRLPEKTQSKQ